MAKRPGKFYYKQLKKLERQNMVALRNGKGDHVVATPIGEYAGNPQMILPINLKGNGTEFSICKWFLKVFGIALTFIIGLLYIIHLIWVMPL